MKNTALAIACLLALVGPRPTQFEGSFPDLVVTGTVTDTDDGLPLGGVEVSAHRASLPSIRARTDASGRFRLSLAGNGWTSGPVTVRFERAGYAPRERTLTLRRDLTTLDAALRGIPPEVEEPSPTVGDARAEGFAERDAALVLAVAAAQPVAPAVERRFRDLPGRHNPNFQTESYAYIDENPFLGVDSNPLSTFSIDVDRASYSNVRRILREGGRPPVDAVRIEELVNYFTYSDPEPSAAEPFSVTTEVTPAPWQPRHHLVRIGLKGRSVDLADVPASNLVFLIDVSGSMQSENKLPLLKAAFRMLVDQLRPRDRVAIVVYAGAAGLVLEPTPGDEKETILEAIGALEAGGSTAGGAGLKLAYEVAWRNRIEGGNNRVILATDGDFNVGPSSDAEMVRLIESRRDRGTFLTVLGFGTGNLKDSKMEQLADHGNGSFAYIDSRLEAKKVLVNQLGGTLLTIAKDVKIQVEFNPARVAAYRLIGYENRVMADEDFADDTRDAGELGAGHSVTALYEIVPVGVEGTVTVRETGELRYQTPPARPDATESPEMLFVKLRYKEPAGSESRLVEHPVMTSDFTERPSTDTRFAAAVAAWGMLLRDSEHVGDFAIADVVSLASGALGRDPGGYRAEFLRLVDLTLEMETLADGPDL